MIQTYIIQQLFAKDVRAPVAILQYCKFMATRAGPNRNRYPKKVYL